MAQSDFDRLEQLLADERERPNPDQARRIDQRLEAAREREHSRPWGSARGWVERLTAQRLSLAGAAATVLVGLAVGIGQLGDQGSSPGPGPVRPAALQDADSGVGAGQPAEPEAAGSGASAVGSKVGPHVTREGGGSILPPVPAPNDGLAPGQAERAVERSAQITISGDPGEVRRMADEVVAITDRIGGIVVSASVSDRPESPAASTAWLEVAVPVERLDRALAEISDVGSVTSREQTDFDVTAEAVSAGNRLRNARETRNALRGRLEQAADSEEIASLRRRLMRAERRVAARKADVQRLANRTQFARIGVGVVGEGHGKDGSWSLDDAWSDALEVLRTMAGVALVTTAVVLPLAILAGLIYLLARRRRGRAREAALDR